MQLPIDATDIPLLMQASLPPLDASYTEPGRTSDD